MTHITSRTLIFTLSLTALLFSSSLLASAKGIYLTQYNFENTSFLTNLIQRAKAAGIDTFVIDLEVPSKRYHQNTALLKDNNIKYVARVIMFPDGGNSKQITTPAYWQRKYRLVEQAVEWGANSIQLDYIRYSSKQPASPENSKNVLNIIKWYKNKLAEKNIPLQVDVFGIASFGESKHIGQNIKLFSQSVDAVCPMVYPSHYVPFPYHFKYPYDTVYDSLISIKEQFNYKMPIKMYAYIELSNYHYPMSHTKTLDYIEEQLEAVEEAGADGWYAWSPHNRYDNLFAVLRSRHAGKALTPAATTPTTSAVSVTAPVKAAATTTPKASTPAPAPAPTPTASAELTAPKRPFLY